MSTTIRLHTRRAGIDDLDALAALFDGYRMFYRQPSDPALARAFLAARLQRGESAVFIADDGDDAAVGFTQLYPLFSSVRAARVWLLNDLFVAPAARKRGVARALLAAAATFARDDGALGLQLETAPDNHAAQALYRACGWQLSDSLYFHLPLA